MEQHSMVTYEGQGRRTIQSITKRREIAQAAATKAENFVEQNLLFDEEVGADIAQESVGWTVAIFGGFGLSVLFCVALFINMIGGF